MLNSDDWSTVAIVKLEGSTLRCALAPDGKLLATSGSVGKVELRALPSGEVVREFNAGTSDIADLTFSPDGGILATAGDDGMLTLWSMPYGKRLRTYHGHSNNIRRVSYSDEGRSLITASSDGTVRLWNANSTNGLHELDGHRILKGHTSDVLTVAFDRTGNLLASGGVDQEIRIWNPENGASVGTLRGHLGAIKCVAFNHDATRLASVGASDQTVRVWDPAMGVELFATRGRNFVAFSPDGNRLAFGTGNTDSIHILDGTPDAAASTQSDVNVPPPDVDKAPVGSATFRVLGYTTSNRLPMVLDQKPKELFVDPQPGQKFFVVMACVWQGDLMPGGRKAIRDLNQLTGLEARQEAMRRRYVNYDPRRFRIRIGELEPQPAVLISDLEADMGFHPSFESTSSQALPDYHRLGLALAIDVPTVTQPANVQISFDDAPFIPVPIEIDSALIDQVAFGLQ